MASNFVRKGCELIKNAIRKETEEQYSEALPLYTMGIQYLLTALKYEKNANVRAAIKKKVQQYLTKAEDMKSEHLSSTNKRKKKKKRKYIYPTQKQINETLTNVNEDSTHLIYGYTRIIEQTLNIYYSIPDGIVNLCLVYYFIPAEYTPDPTKYITVKPNIKWNDVAGVHDAKQSLKEFLILPLKFPQLFRNKTPQNVLLYGAPGCGKTLLSKAVANEAENATCFRVSGCDLVSKYLSQSEKLIANLFSMARDKNPSLIVFDEIDSFCGSRSSYEYDYPRRNRTEFLDQMQGVGRKCNKQLFVIGITNCPWDLDPVIRRRFQKRIYVELPDKEARRYIFEMNVGDTPNKLCDSDYVRLAELSEGFSGSDISSLVRDAMMTPVRNIQNATHFKRVMKCDSDIENDYKLVACNAMDDGAMEMSLMDISVDEQNKIDVQKLEIEHFLATLETFRATVGEEDIQRYTDWGREFGDEME